ncbi:MAG: hypothetical protein Q7S45_01125 [Candidatus Curtissbacteria bacterium]|nr:hypothetical protein [Candidatus Curtissbacteria bacterium]
MRDLSNSFPPKKKFKNNRILRILVLVVVITVVIFFLKNFSVGDGFGGGSDVTLKDASFGLKPVMIGKTTVASGGVNLATQTITLTDIKYGGEARATATRSYGAGIYKLDVSATLPDPKNVAYEVWLTGADGPVPIDVMRGTKNSWSLNLSDSDKFSKYTGILISLERNKADSIVEERVMEGSF